MMTKDELIAKQQLEDDCEYLIEQLRGMQKYGVIEKVDAPIEFKGVLEREFRL